MSGRAIPQALIDAQHKASDPAVSAWVSANAGAGKTHVLAQRVIRLLLTGTRPEKILCLTFTKAAAANMANRIFKTLSEWTSFEDDKLDDAIRATGSSRVDAKLRHRARQLFAAALETPGGLKVQTIHAFCTQLLQQFPFEANVPAHFSVLEESQQQQLLQQLRREMLLKAANAPDSDLNHALAAIIPICSDFSFQLALDEAIRKRGPIMRWLEAAGGLDKAMDELSRTLGINPADTLETVEAAIVDGPHLPSSEWASVAQVCATGSSNDKDQGKRFAAAAALTGNARLSAYFSVFFRQDGKERAALITKNLVAQNSDFAQRLLEEKIRIIDLCERRRAILSRDRTRALLTLSLDIINRYETEKTRHGLLDYDDLIGRTRDLLENTNAAWVHYKLDLGIDHILIDEAQDTSPTQWDIITKFAAEFTAGDGTRGTIERTIFAVGDEKQSIFSFQGAAPKSFDDKKRYFETAHRNAKKTFVPVPMLHSFRSVPVVLEAVDWVFKNPASRKGLSADPAETLHTAVRASAPGLVEIWDLFQPDEKKEVEPWDAPFDLETATSPRVKLARQIANAIKVWRTRGELVGDGPDRHPLRAGDILILVRQRGPLFEAIIRQLKNANIPVAGADRLVLTEHIAIMDLLTLADAILHPRDDLALATVLKSPLFRLTDDELLALAAERMGGLHQALQQHRPDVAKKFDAIAQAAQNCTPFSFYAELLGAHGGRKAFVSRLGHEANDALDEFLNLALDYEKRETPSLQGFTAWLRTASATVKRDMEMARDEVRVMTVHGAKGLEAPLVILADTTTLPAGPPHMQPRILGLPAIGAAPDAPNCLVWVPTKKEDIGATAEARDRLIADDEDEYRRLLYVAMTRAGDRLVVCGSVGERDRPEGCWYELITQGLAAGGMLKEEPADFGDGVVKRYRGLQKPEEARAVIAPMTTEDEAPFWLKQAAPVEADMPQPITPSMFYDDHAPPPFAAFGEGRQKALARGNLVHRMMQSLPDLLPEWRESAARNYLARHAKDFSAAEQDALVTKVLALFADKRFAELFAPDSRAEVAIAGRLEGHPISGQIDRLVIGSKAVLIADYKTNNPAPRRLEEVPEAYVKQLALYRAVLEKLYPDRPVRAALVWTETPEIMEIPASRLDAAAAMAAMP